MLLSLNPFANNPSNTKNVRKQAKDSSDPRHPFCRVLWIEVPDDVIEYGAVIVRMVQLEGCGAVIVISECIERTRISAYK